MAWELEGLIAGLLVLISCAGEQGCPVSDILDTIRDNTGAPHHVGGDKDLLDENSPLHRTASTVWTWLVGRRDVSVGPDRKYNHLTLDEVLSLSVSSSPGAENATELEFGPGETQSTPALISPPDRARVYVSEETMWESITGHAVDYKRVPRSEWLLLLGIASTRSQGILQGDLGRLVDQDKRSVPKRTDALVRKGYIVKRTTLVRGTKTSKLWLRQFARPLPKDSDNTDEPRVEMNISRQVLTANLDPVPWHTRWTGESIDYTALATTIMAVAKEWGVLRMQDLKSKLGVLGLRWQMKVLAKVCRFLNARGAIQYVAAKLGDRVFKDCIKFGHDLSSEDWAVYLATGKRTKPSRVPDTSTGDAVDSSDHLFVQNTNALEISSAPPWSVDKPLPAIVVEMAWRFGENGLTNPDLYSLTLGSTFSRYLSSMTATLSTPNLQPPHLKHLQLRSEHTRVGKIASYRYFAEQPGVSTTAVEADGSAATASQRTQENVSRTQSDSYGFGPVPVGNLAESPISTLSGLCQLGTAKNRPRGRPKRDKQSDVVEPPGNNNTRQHKSPPPDLGKTQKVSEEQSTAPTSLAPRVKEKPSRVVKVRVSPEALQTVIAQAPAQSPPTRLSRPRRARSQRQLIDSEISIPPIESDEEINLPNKSPNASPSKKRVRKRKLDKIGNANAEPRPWKCDKCDGSWKNDIGLKYHLEKSRTPCNPSYAESTQATPRRGGRKAAFFMPQLSRSPMLAVNNPVSIDEPTNQMPTEPPLEDASKTDADLGSQTSIQKPSSSSQGLPPRLSNGLAGGLNQATPEWRRPPVTALERSGKSSLPGSGTSALLQDEDSQPRQVLTLSNVRSLMHGQGETNFKEVFTTKQPFKNEHPQYTQEPTPFHVDEKSLQTPPRDIDGSYQNMELPADRIVDDPISPHLHHHETTFSDAIPKPETPIAQHDEERSGPSGTSQKKKISRAILNDQIREAIESILIEQDGVFPGGEVLRHAFEARWKEIFSPQAAPTSREYNLGFSEMLRNKSASEHWHAFRDRKGMFSKCQVIVQRNTDPFSAEVMDVVGRIKAAYPQQYFPPPFKAPAGFVPKDGKRGRRLLPSEVEVLDAPVYAAQIHAKRSADFEDTGPAFKRRKRMHRVTKKGQRMAMSPRNTRKMAARGWIMGDQDECDFDHEGPDLPAPLPMHGPSEKVRFLSPNTYLYADPPGTNIQTSSWEKELSEQQGHVHSDPSQFFPKDLIFAKASQVFGRNGSWPYLRVVDFETQDTGYALKGWMPDSQWFSWEAIIQEVEKRAMLPGSIARSRIKTDDGKYYRIIDRLVACAETELDWTESFVDAPVGAAGPHNIFIDIVSESSTNESQLPSVVWPPDGQLTEADFAGTVSTSNSEDDFDLNVYKHSSSQAWRQDQSVLDANAPADYIFAPPTYVYLQRNKRVPLMARSLTTLPDSSNESSDAIQDRERVLAAFVAVRVLLGGSDKAIDWGLLMRIFPDISLKALRRFWLTIRKEQGPHISRMTRDFQEKFLPAYERGELPEIDFDDPTDYDWHSLLEWMLQLPRQVDIHIPSNRSLFLQKFDMHETNNLEEDAQEKFFHAQSSVFARFEVATRGIGVALDEAVDEHYPRAKVTDLDVAKSWIKSLCCTVETKYSVDQIKQKFLTLAGGGERHITTLLKQAIDDLTRQRVICKSKKPPLGGRPYRLNEWYVYMLGKLSQRAKYREAGVFKTKLDDTFRQQERYMLPYTLDDGSVMALTNLNASGRIKIVPVDLPYIPYGFQPGNYESRKYPKSWYHFRMEVIPTKTYLYDEDIEVLKAAAEHGPPPAGSMGELPQWIDFFGVRNPRRWIDVLGAFCFAFATRGPMSIDGICSALRPILEPPEAQIIMDWGKRTGVLKDSEDGLGVTVGEWWWLVISKQLK